MEFASRVLLASMRGDEEYDEIEEALMQSAGSLVTAKNNNTADDGETCLIDLLDTAGQVCGVAAFAS